MPQTLAPIQIRDLSTGIVQGVDNALAPKNCLSFALNLEFDSKIGRAKSRLGTALVGAQIASGKNILGLHQFILSSGVKHLLAVVDGAANSALYRLITATWTTESLAGVKAVKHRFLTYLDTVMVLDGTNATASADGDTWVTTGGNLDIANCPKGKFAIEWHDRVYVAGVASYLDTLYYSSIPTGTAISWTTGNGSMQIEPYEGQGAITGLGKVPGYILVFKERALKRWDGASTHPDDLCSYGTPSHESIVNGKSTAFFFSASGKRSIGFYETNGETVRKLSRPIQDIVNAILPANYASVAGYSDGEIVMWSVGDVIYDGITYTNVCLYYHVETKTWAAFSFPSSYRVFAKYIDASGNIKIVAGDNDGQIIDVFTGTFDNITGSSNIPIQIAAHYYPMELGSRGRVKEIAKIVPYTKDCLGCKVSLRMDENKGFDTIGEVRNPFENEITIDKKGHTFEFRLAGPATGGESELIGFDLLQPEVNDTIKR